MQNVHKVAEPPLARLLEMLFPDFPKSAKSDCDLHEHLGKYLLRKKANDEQLKKGLSKHFEQREFCDVFDVLNGIRDIAAKNELKDLNAITVYLELQRNSGLNKLLNCMPHIGTDEEIGIKSVENDLLSLENVSPKLLREALKEMDDAEEPETNGVESYSMEDGSIQIGMVGTNLTTGEIKRMSPEDMSDISGGGFGTQLKRKVMDTVCYYGRTPHGDWNGGFNLG